MPYSRWTPGCCCGTGECDVLTGILPFSIDGKKEYQYTRTGDGIPTSMDLDRYAPNGITTPAEETEYSEDNLPYYDINNIVLTNSDHIIRYNGQIYFDVTYSAGTFGNIIEINGKKWKTANTLEIERVTAMGYTTGNYKKTETDSASFDIGKTFALGRVLPERYSFRCSKAAAGDIKQGYFDCAFYFQDEESEEIKPVKIFKKRDSNFLNDHEADNEVDVFFCDIVPEVTFTGTSFNIPAPVDFIKQTETTLMDEKEAFYITRTARIPQAAFWRSSSDFGFTDYIESGICHTFILTKGTMHVIDRRYYRNESYPAYTMSNTSESQLFTGHLEYKVKYKNEM